MLRVQAILTAMIKMMTLKVLIHGGDENDGDDVSTDHDDGGMKDANHQNSVDGLRKSQGSGSDSHTRVIVGMIIPFPTEWKIIRFIFQTQTSIYRGYPFIGEIPWFQIPTRQKCCWKNPSERCQRIRPQSAGRQQTTSLRQRRWPSSIWATVAPIPSVKSGRVIHQPMDWLVVE